MIIAVALAGLAVVAAVVVLASGGGGELAEAHPDHPPLPLPGNRPIAGTDAALLRLPVGLWGYHVRISDEALRRLAYALTERDTRIAILEQQVAELRHKLESVGAIDSLEPATGRPPGTWLSANEQQAAWTPPAQSLEMESRPDPDLRAEPAADPPEQSRAKAAQPGAAQARKAQARELRAAGPQAEDSRAEESRAAEDGKD